mmetsp:Transcript_30223/g.78053  ORF Transcript_30223/g.78053 Transcript_30223/m.78053 type:complete len:201 (+) Transcript_30223:727-1329(+)
MPAPCPVEPACPGCERRGFWLHCRTARWPRPRRGPTQQSPRRCRMPEQEGTMRWSSRRRCALSSACRHHSSCPWRKWSSYWQLRRPFQLTRCWPSWGSAPRRPCGCCWGPLRTVWWWCRRRSAPPRECLLGRRCPWRSCGSWWSTWTPPLWRRCSPRPPVTRSSCWNSKSWPSKLRPLGGPQCRSRRGEAPRRAWFRWTR